MENCGNIQKKLQNNFIFGKKAIPLHAIMAYYAQI